ncbi:alpha-N-acetylgalactosamine-specific lectin-like [Antedon mediterranea]|uniref:alpha-N-acetylgalactosamine-specific lectin-like n=1 Tax=Antedon mediterranea TaxID=105859 RepID=UPI003AF9B5E9
MRDGCYTTRNANGHLVSIRSEEENEFVSRLWNSATDGLVTMREYHTYWIGLTDKNEERKWRWSDTNMLTNYTNWDSDQPNNWKGNQTCVSFWNNRHCFGLQTTWNDLKCCNALGIAKGHLVSIRSEEENEFVSKLWNSATDGLVTRNSGVTYWIGLTDAKDEGKWRWSDTNTLATYTNWDKKEPNNNGNQDCVTVWNRNGLQTKWDDVQCTYEHGSVCKLPQNNY